MNMCVNIINYAHELFTLLESQSRTRKDLALNQMQLNSTGRDFQYFL